MFSSYWWFVACTAINFVSSLALSKHPVLIVIAFDGFRFDYMKRDLTPALQEIAANGTRVRYLFNQFPTVTFVNFHSISTGMHAESHGVLGNKVFNEKKDCLGYGYELFHYNEDIIPIWILNESTGDERYSGVMMWPGSNFHYQNRFPTYQTTFDPSIAWKTRVDIILNWITNEQKPANLVYMYFEQPDEDGHRYGPNSPQVNDQLKNINEIVLHLTTELSKRDIRDEVNLVFLSDHGMASVSGSGVIDLNQHLDPSSYTFCGSSPGLQILPKPGNEETVYEGLKQLSHQLQTFTVYKSNDIPDRWYYKKNKRNIGYFVEANINYVFKDAEKLKGDHGYDNADLQMHPIFIAQGPLFKRNYQAEPFQNIDIYPLIVRIMGLNSPPAHVTPNGTLARIEHILTKSKLSNYYQYFVVN